MKNNTIFDNQYAEIMGNYKYEVTCSWETRKIEMGRRKI